MIVTNNLSNYRSKSVCNLDMFRVQPQMHEIKTWKSKDTKVHFIVEMENMHLWHCYNMLMLMLDEGSHSQQSAAANALQYIGHELFVRKMNVPRLPDKSFRKLINHADNVNYGFTDSNDLFDFTNDIDDILSEGWDGGEFYKY